MNISDLAQQAVTFLRPELLLLAGKSAEAAASETGKKLVAWFQEKLKGKSAALALEDARQHPEDDLRIQALQVQIAILAQENEAFRGDLEGLLAKIGAGQTTRQHAVVRGRGNKTAIVSGDQNETKIS